MCSLASAFSQVPYYLRKTVESVTVVYAETGYSYTSNHRITVGTKDPVDANVLTHESAHSQVRLQQAFVEVLEQESCLSDITMTVSCHLQDWVCTQDGGFSSSSTWTQVLTPQLLTVL